MRRRPRGSWALVALAVLPGCSRESDPRSGPAKKRVPVVRVAPARVETLVRRVELPGSVEPTRLARLASPAEGPVQRLLVREGDRVRRGQLLVAIGRRSASRALVVAEREQLRKASVELERVKRLVARGAVPKEQLDRARAEHEQARASVEAGMQRSGDYLVRAPWSGVVSKVPVREGNFVAPRTTLVEVFDPMSLVVSLALPEALAMNVSRNSAVRVTFDALGDRVLSAHLSRLYPELDRRLRTRVAELTVDDAPSLVPGMFARVSLIVARAKDAVAVPRSAIRVGVDGRRVVLLADGGKISRRPVQIGIESKGRVQILAGVAAGQRVVVAGPLKLADGVRVQVKAANSTKAAHSANAPATAPTSPATSARGAGR